MNLARYGSENNFIYRFVNYIKIIMQNYA